MLTVYDYIVFAGCNSR